MSPCLLHNEREREKKENSYKNFECHQIGCVWYFEDKAIANLELQLSLVVISFSVCVCEQIGCRTITSTLLYRFSPNFACGSEMWSLWHLLFMGQTGSSFPTLEVCGIRFRQFSGSGDHIFQQISTKSHTQIKFSNADLVFNNEWNQLRLCTQMRPEIQIEF